jgi:hypothetical protein
MYDKSTNNKIKYLNLETPKDARDLICDVLTEIRDAETMAEHAGKICNLLQVWLKCYQIERISEIEKRLEALEKRFGLEGKE